MIKATNILLTVIAGIAVALILFWVLNWLVERLPRKWEYRLKPYVFILPAFLAIVAYLVYPAILTILDSFKNDVSTSFVGVSNYKRLFTDGFLKKSEVCVGAYAQYCK